MPRKRRSRRESAPLRIEWYGYRERGRDYHTPGHIHRFHQWYHVVLGAARLRVNESIFQLKPGQSVLISPGATREIWCGRRPPGYFSAVFDIRDPLDLSDIMDQTLEITRDLESDAAALVAEARRPQPDAGLLAHALLTRLMLGFKRNRGLNAAAPTAIHRNWSQSIVERIELFLQQNFHRRLSRGDVAGHLSMSEGHAARVYRAATGLTLVDRITQLRIEAAKGLLLDSTLSITQIALEVGYGSFSHFSKQFKKLETISPGDYRRASGKLWQTVWPDAKSR